MRVTQQLHGKLTSCLLRSLKRFRHTTVATWWDIGRRDHETVMCPEGSVKWKGAPVLDNPVIIILDLMMLFLVVWVTLAISLNMRDAHRWKRLQQAHRQAKASETVPVEQVIRLAEWKRLQQAHRQDEAPETVPVEQVIRLAEWKMQQSIGERE